MQMYTVKPNSSNGTAPTLTLGSLRAAVLNYLRFINDHSGEFVFGEFGRIGSNSTVSGDDHICFLLYVSIVTYKQKNN